MDPYMKKHLCVPDYRLQIKSLASFVWSRTKCSDPHLRICPEKAMIQSSRERRADNMFPPEKNKELVAPHWLKSKNSRGPLTQKIQTQSRRKLSKRGLNMHLKSTVYDWFTIGDRERTIPTAPARPRARDRLLARSAVSL